MHDPYHSQQCMREMRVNDLLGPTSTSLDDKFYRRDPQPKKVSYPNLEWTAKTNKRTALEAKRALASKLYKQLQQRLPHMRNAKKEKTRQYLRTLRPSIKTLKYYYLGRGDTIEVVDKLVTPENYPYLPKVWLTKYQLRVLLDTVDGNEQQHESYINHELLK